MATRVLDSSPRILPLYARAAAPLLPGASLLPFVPGRGKEIPEIELEQTGVRADTAALAAYGKVCGFTLREQLPPTYPHVLAFPLHMAVMADGAFPFGAVGLVHVENRIVQRRPLAVGEELTIRVKPTPLQPHPKGRTFTIVTEVSAGEEPAWEGVSTFLRRGKPPPNAVSPGMREKVRSDEAEELAPLPADAPAAAEWRLGGDLGRRYASVSGDRNPIHLHSLTAKPLGFPGAIAHGMWTKARCLAALEGRLPDAFEVEVRFRKPIQLPGVVAFASATEDEQIDFSVRDAKRGTPHLDGRARALAPQTTTGRSR
jgi:acyl dehydratase